MRDRHGIEFRRAYAGWFCEEWNARFPVGTPVTLRPDLPEPGVADGPFETVTRSQACVMYEDPVVWVQDRPGCYRLDRVEATSGPSPSSLLEGPPAPPRRL